MLMSLCCYYVVMLCCSHWWHNNMRSFLNLCDSPLCRYVASVNQALPKVLWCTPSWLHWLYDVWCHSSSLCCLSAWHVLCWYSLLWPGNWCPRGWRGFASQSAIQLRTTHHPQVSQTDWLETGAWSQRQDWQVSRTDWLEMGVRTPRQDWLVSWTEKEIKICNN